MLKKLAGIGVSRIQIKGPSNFIHGVISPQTRCHMINFEKKNYVYWAKYGFYFSIGIQY